MKEFTDFVEAGLSLVSTMETHQWQLGDLCVSFEDAMSDEGATLNDYARALQVQRSTLSEYRSNAHFYPEQFRTFDALGFAHYTLARKAAAGDIENALDLLTIAEAQAHSVSDFKRYLAGVYAEMPVKVADLPHEVRGLVPTGERVVWVEVSKYKGDDK